MRRLRLPCADCQEQGPSWYLCSSDLRSPKTQGPWKVPQPLFGVPEILSLPSRQYQGRVRGRKTLQGMAASPRHPLPQPYSPSLPHPPALL